MITTYFLLVVKPRPCFHSTSPVSRKNQVSYPYGILKGIALTILTTRIIILDRFASQARGHERPCEVVCCHLREHFVLSQPESSHKCRNVKGPLGLHIHHRTLLLRDSQTDISSTAIQSPPVRSDEEQICLQTSMGRAPSGKGCALPEVQWAKFEGSFHGEPHKRGWWIEQGIR
jgi:hypothetical protein